jgi:hypothetical protein
MDMDVDSNDSRDIASSARRRSPFDTKSISMMDHPHDQEYDTGSIVSNNCTYNDKMHIIKMLQTDPTKDDKTNDPPLTIHSKYADRSNPDDTTNIVVTNQKRLRVAESIGMSHRVKGVEVI